MPRTHYTNPDFRRDPKTNRFCCVCQRDIKGKPAGFVYLAGGGMDVYHLEDAPHQEDALRWEVGSECLKKIPAEFVERGE